MVHRGGALFAVVGYGGSLAGVSCSSYDLGVRRLGLLGGLVGLGVVGCLAGAVGGGAGVAAGGERACPAVRDRLWTSDTLHDWVSFF
jgi:hypothetical protein